MDDVVGNEAPPAAGTTPIMRRLMELECEGVSRRQILEAAFLLFEETEAGDLVDSPETIARYVGKRYGRVDQQVVGALFVNAACRLLREREIFRGTMSKLPLEPRALYAEALRLSAYGFVIFRIGPGENSRPTSMDHAFESTLSETSKLLGVQLIDYLIVGQSGKVASLRRDWAVYPAL